MYKFISSTRKSQKIHQILQISFKLRRTSSVAVELKSFFISHPTSSVIIRHRLRIPIYARLIKF